MSRRRTIVAAPGVSSRVTPCAGTVTSTASTHRPFNPIQPRQVVTVESVIAGDVPVPLDPPLYVLTSLSPSHVAGDVQRAAIRSWRIAGLRVVSFNHQSELDTLRNSFDDVDFVAVERTAIETFGKHYVHISTMLRWAAEHDTTVLLCNSDIVLQSSPEQLQQLRDRSVDGLAYIIRCNHDGDLNLAIQEPYGIDAFMFHGQHVASVVDSLFVMGQPAWDWWLPYVFLKDDRPLYAVGGRIAFHRKHPFQWSQSGYDRCTAELARIAGIPANDVRSLIDRSSVPLVVD